MKSSVIANQKARIKLHRKIFERIKKSNEKHFVNLCETIPPSALYLSTSNATNIELARILFPVENAKQIT